MKNIKITIIIFISILLFTACNMNKSNTNNIDIELIPPFEVMMSDIPIGQVLDFERFEDKIILVGFGINDNNIPITSLYTFNSEGELLNKIDLCDNEDVALQGLTHIDSNGYIWILTIQTNLDFSNLIKKNTTANIYCFDINGNLINKINISENQINFDSNLSNYFNTLIVGDNGEFYIQNNINKSVLILDKGGNKLFEINNKNINYIFKLTNGSVYAGVKNYQNYENFEINIENECLGEKLNIVSANSNEVIISGNDNSSLYICGINGINEYNIEFGNIKEIINWSERDIDGNELYNDFLFNKIITFDTKNIFMLTYDYSNITGLSFDNTHEKKVKLIKINTEQKPTYINNKKIITASQLYNDSSITNLIKMFNKQNDNYKIELKTYVENSDENSKINALNQFNLDIISGKISDIVFFKSSFNTEKYSEKGLFVDLYSFIDKDADINRGDYLPNILELMETNDKLYTLSPSFGIHTIIGKVSDVGDKKGWSWNDYYKLLENKPNDIIPIAVEHSTISKEHILKFSLREKIINFVDYENNICDFEHPDFIKLLKMTDSYPLTEEEFNLNDLKNGNPLLLSCQISNFSFSNSTIYESYFNDKITYIGYPTDDGNNGSTAWLYDSIAMTKSAVEKEGAWEFLKYVLTDFQNTAGNIGIQSIQGFPIKISSLENQVQKSLEIYSNVAIENTNGGLYRNPDKNDYIKIINLINSINFKYIWDDDIQSIISEESESFFMGQKSAEEVAEIIQNRVSVYLSEMN